MQECTEQKKPDQEEEFPIGHIIVCCDKDGNWSAKWSNYNNKYKRLEFTGNKVAGQRSALGAICYLLGFLEDNHVLKR